MEHMEKQRILIVDDEKINLSMLWDLLKTEYTITIARNGRQALQRAMSDHPPDLILLDVMMPDMDGYEVIKELKSRDDTRGIPVIFVSAMNSDEDEESGLLLGASDYITKPFHPPIVKARVANQMTIVRQRRLLEKQALLDGLTEIPNRRCFLKTLDAEWRRCTRKQQPLSLGIADVDYFKEYNDRYGHPAGDRVLKQVADTLMKGIRRPGDLVARYGGEEFALLLTETGEKGAQGVAENLRRSIRNLDIPHGEAPLTISIGICTMFPEPGSDPAHLLHMADKALYRAKADGRNRVCARFTADLTE